MPRDYRRRHSNGESFSESESFAESIDHDDSIILSGLVRTGEASRLRRRGAMRLDHAPHLHRPASPPVIVVDTSPVLGSFPDHDREPLGAGAVHRRRPPRERPSSRTSTDMYRYSVFCGGFDDASIEDVTPFKVTALPVSSSDRAGKRQSRRLNGCGALLHVHGSPKPELGVWQAKGAATDAVVVVVVASVKGLDVLPEGPRIWRSSTHLSYIYTFFSDAVSSFPEYTFPQRSKLRSSSPHVDVGSTATLTPNDNEGATIFDRFLTASPQSYSDLEDLPREERETRDEFWRDTIGGYRLVDDDVNSDGLSPSIQSRQTTILPGMYMAPANFDPDGEFLSVDRLSDPGSPDKVFEPALLP
ncbi:hypothetical protein PC9H_004510 [Pleurotus ostreatus]|uniref:Uncharacterized protein n=1 Tax=Pleurotus ostreatus TaxID=5322 RepID=A0A8H6ZXC7_PLEOS|nr:uncharacterized protein PC9H_004510 [Pleurotus ostreatus]KAF7432569.1 hypothetical protein PC9H_004510 [Pleurotus ostreatus]